MKKNTKPIAMLAVLAALSGCHDGSIELFPDTSSSEDRCPSCSAKEAYGRCEGDASACGTAATRDGCEDAGCTWITPD